MLILLALLCANPDLQSAKSEFLIAAKAKADSITDEPAAARIRNEMQEFLTDDRQIPSSPHLLALRDRYISQRAMARHKLLDSLSDAERILQESQWDRDDEVAALPMRTKWLRPEGALLPGHYFAVIHGKVWGEHNEKNVVQSRWQETNRTAEYVEIVGKIGTVRLYEGTLFHRPVDSTTWASAEGRWVE